MKPVYLIKTRESFCIASRPPHFKEKHIQELRSLGTGKVEKRKVPDSVSLDCYTFRLNAIGEAAAFKDGTLPLAMSEADSAEYEHRCAEIIALKESLRDFVKAVIPRSRKVRLEDCENAPKNSRK